MPFEREGVLDIQIEAVSASSEAQAHSPFAFNLQDDAEGRHVSIEP